MSIREALKKSTIEAAKAKDQVKLDTMRMTSSAIKYREIEKKGPLEEAEVMAVITSLCKQRRDSIEQYEKGGRQDLADKEKRELELLLAFLPQQMTREELTEKVKSAISKTGAQSIKEMGKVMKALLSDIAGRADGAMVSDVVKSLLK